MRGSRGKHVALSVAAISMASLLAAVVLLRVPILEARKPAGLPKMGVPNEPFLPEGLMR